MRFLHHYTDERTLQLAERNRQQLGDQLLLVTGQRPDLGFDPLGVDGMFEILVGFPYSIDVDTATKAAGALRIMVETLESGGELP